MASRRRARKPRKKKCKECGAIMTPPESRQDWWSFKQRKYCSIQCTQDARYPAPTPEEIEERAAQVRKERDDNARGRYKQGRADRLLAHDPGYIKPHKIARNFNYQEGHYKIQMTDDSYNL